MIREYLDKRKLKKEEEKKAVAKRREEIGIFREYFELISEVLIYVFFVMTFLLQSFVIPTESMVDTILVGDHLLVNKVAYSRHLGKLDGFLLPQLKIDRNMIVTFKSPPEMKKEYVKRVIGLPGDLIRIENQKIILNGKPFDDRFGKFRADYPENFAGEKSITFKERVVYAIEDGTFVINRFVWKKNKIEFIKENYFLGTRTVKVDTYNIEVKKGEVITDIEDLAMRAKSPSTKIYQINKKIDMGNFFKNWQRDNFPLDVEDYEVANTFNEKTDFSRYIVKIDGKNYFKVPQGYYFCMGDNRDHSWDSRFWGPVPEDYIIGKPWRIYWSYDANDYLQKGIENKIKGLLNTIKNFFSKTRWERTGKLVK